jgi:hypothetical protein
VAGMNIISQNMKNGFLNLKPDRFGPMLKTKFSGTTEDGILPIMPQYGVGVNIINTILKPGWTGQ